MRIAFGLKTSDWIDFAIDIKVCVSDDVNIDVAVGIDVDVSDNFSVNVNVDMNVVAWLKQGFSQTSRRSRKLKEKHGFCHVYAGEL